MDIELHDHVVVRCDLRLDLQGERGLPEADARRTGRRRGLVRDLGALLDVGLDVVSRDDARTRDELAARVELQCRDLEVQEAGLTRIEQRERECTRGSARGAQARRREVNGQGIREEALRVVLRLAGLHTRASDVATEEHPEAIGAGHGETVALRDRAKSCAKRTTEGVGRLDDAGFDHHLTHRHVDLLDELRDLLELAGRVLDEHRVGARIDDGTASFRQHALIHVGQQLLDRIGLLVAQLETFCPGGLEFLDLLLGFERELFLGRQFVARCDPDDVAVLAHVQSLGLENDVERLIPGDILQPQREVAGHGVARDDVQTREVGDDLKDGTHFDVLEVERQLVAHISATGGGADLRRVLDDLLDLDDQPVVGLIGRVLPIAARGDDDAGVAALARGLDCIDGCGEVRDVELALQVGGDLRLHEFDDDRLALTTDVDPGGGVGQIDDQLAFARLAAAEVDVEQRVRHVGLARRELHAFVSASGRNLRGTATRLQVHLHHVAVQLYVVLHGTRQVQYDPGAPAGLTVTDRAQFGIAHFLAGLADTVRRARKIERDSGRVVDGKAGGDCGQRLARRDLHDDSTTLSGEDVDGLDAVRPRRGG